MKQLHKLILVFVLTGLVVSACSQETSETIPTSQNTPTKIPESTSTTTNEPTTITSEIQTQTPESATPQSTSQDTTGIWPESVTDLTTGNASKGETILFSLGCIACHGHPDQVGSNVISPWLGNIAIRARDRVSNVSAQQYIYESLMDPNEYIVPDCPTGPCSNPSLMLSDYSHRLSSEEMASLIAYLMTKTHPDSSTPSTVTPGVNAQDELIEDTSSPNILEIETKIETIKIERLPLPVGSYTTYQTVPFVDGLLFDDAGYLWAHLSDGYVRWNTNTNDYIRTEPPSDIADYIPPSPYSYCQNLAGSLGLENASLLFFTSCLHSSLDNSYWFATYSFGELVGGIYNFDGTTWIHQTTENGLPSDDISKLLIDEDGVIWAATFGGVASYDGETWTSQLGGDDDPNQVVTAMAFDTEGNLWAGKRNGRLMFFDGETWSEHDIGIQGRAITNILSDSFGGLWIPDWPLLYQFEDDTWQPISLDPSNNDYYSVGIHDIDRTDSGQIWIGTDSGVLQIDNDDIAWYGQQNGLADNYVMDVLIGPDNAPWFATSRGISHFDGKTWQTLNINEGPGISFPMSAFTDATGKVWFGGADGVVSLQDIEMWQQYPEISDELALINFAISSEGSLLGAGCSGIYEFSNNGWQLLYGNPDASILQERMPWCATRIAVAKDGSIWVNQMDIPQDNGHGALKITDSGYEWYGKDLDARFYPDLVTDVPWNEGYITSILPREDGSVWFGTTEGVFIFSEDEWHKLPDDVYGESPWITTGTIGPDGDAWFGTPLGFAQFDGEIWTSYQPADQTQLDIFAFTFEERGKVWISTFEGIGIVDGETLRLYEYGDEGPFNIQRPELLGVSIAGIADSIAIGPNNNLWLPGGPRGIIRIELPSP